MKGVKGLEQVFFKMVGFGNKEVELRNYGVVDFISKADTVSESIVQLTTALWLVHGSDISISTSWQLSEILGDFCMSVCTNVSVVSLHLSSGYH